MNTLVQEKTEAKIINSFDYAESYNSHFRAVVNKPVNEKYARKIVQTLLKENGIYGVNVNKLYVQNNGIKSQQEDGWVFGLTVNVLYYRQLANISESQD